MDVIIRYYLPVLAQNLPVCQTASRTKPKPPTRLAKQFSAPPPSFLGHTLSSRLSSTFSPPFLSPSPFYDFPLFPANNLPQRPILGLFLPFSLGFPFLDKPQKQKAKKYTKLAQGKRSAASPDGTSSVAQAFPLSYVVTLVRTDVRTFFTTMLHLRPQDDAYFLSIPFFLLSYVDPLPKTASAPILFSFHLFLYTLYYQGPINIHTLYTYTRTITLNTTTPY